MTFEDFRKMKEININVTIKIIDEFDVNGRSITSKKRADSWNGYAHELKEAIDPYYRRKKRNGKSRSPKSSPTIESTHNTKTISRSKVDCISRVSSIQFDSQYNDSIILPSCSDIGSRDKSRIDALPEISKYSNLNDVPCPTRSQSRKSKSSLSCSQSMKDKEDLYVIDAINDLKIIVEYTYLRMEMLMDRVNIMEKLRDKEMTAPNIIIEKPEQKINVEDLSEDQLKVKQWLEEEVKLGEYFRIFAEHGIDDLETVNELNNDLLKQIGIHKSGHRIKLVRYIKRLNLN